MSVLTMNLHGVVSVVVSPEGGRNDTRWRTITFTCADGSQFEASYFPERGQPVPEVLFGACEQPPVALPADLDGMVPAAMPGEYLVGGETDPRTAKPYSENFGTVASMEAHSDGPRTGLWWTCDACGHTEPRVEGELPKDMKCGLCSATRLIADRPPDEPNGGAEGSGR